MIKNMICMEILADITSFIPINPKWAKLRVSKNFDLFLLKKHKCWIPYINFFNIINEVGRKVNAIHLRVNNIRDIDRLTMLNGLLESIWACSQTIALITARQLPEFNANFQILISLMNIIQRGGETGETGLRAAASTKILILQDFFTLLLNAADDIGNNVMALFFDISHGHLQPLVARLDQFL